MADQQVRWRTRVAVPASEAFAWYKRPGAFERLAPPWEPVRVLHRSGGIDGGRATVQVKVAGVPVNWVAEHTDYVEGEQFRDVQVSGPFAKWEHTHRVEPDGEEACYLVDEIVYALPLGRAGQALGGKMSQRRLERMLAYRHRVMADDLQAHRREAQGRRLTVAISGSHGLIGSAVADFLTTGGHHVKRLVRSRPKGDDEIGWSPQAGEIEPAKLEGVDVVVHLAGETLMERWTQQKKQRIRTSRVEGTRNLSEALAGLVRPPATLISASAMGFYGDRGDELLDETSPPGQGFLPEVCQAWEAAAEPAAAAGIRVVHPRFGLILSPRGGALKQMLPVFKAGLGGPLGNGRMWWSWMTLNDVVDGLYHLMWRETASGPVNMVSTEPVRNRDFTRTLAAVLRRPALLPVPKPAAKLALGQFADEGLFSSARLRPARLEQSGYTFRDPELEPALRTLLGR